MVTLKEHKHRTVELAMSTHTDGANTAAVVFCSAPLHCAVMSSKWNVHKTYGRMGNCQAPGVIWDADLSH